jgi:hypothetical protein
MAALPQFDDQTSLEPYSILYRLFRGECRPAYTNSQFPKTSSGGTMVWRVSFGHDDDDHGDEDDAYE